MRIGVDVFFTEMVKPLEKWTKVLNQAQKLRLIVLLVQPVNEQLGKSYAKTAFGLAVHRIAVRLKSRNNNRYINYNGINID